MHRHWLTFLVLTAAVGCSRAPQSSQGQAPPSPAVPSAVSESTARTRSASPPLRGEYRYYAEVASFRPCDTEQRYPVLPDSQSLRLEQAYLRAQVPTHMLVEITGELTQAQDASGRTRPHLRVDSVRAIYPDQTCED